MSIDAPALGWLSVAGTPYEIGRALGTRGRAAVHALLIRDALWADITAPRHAEAVDRMAGATRERFPWIWEEIQGLADGLELPILSVFAWNCRGDLLASVPDGCTTVQLPGPEICIAHNEDGHPFFRGHCFIAEVARGDRPGFLSFCYPGSIPGHTFAVTEAGLVQAVNNMRLRGVVPSLPRMVIGRAALACGRLDEALDLLRHAPPSGGFHFSLAQAGDSRLMSVEFGAGTTAMEEIREATVHANHALRRPAGAPSQVITRSSGDRQRRGEALLRAGEREPERILRDKGGDGLPIHRTAPDDPDDENTLATAVFRIAQKGVRWTIYDGTGTAPIYASDH